VRFGFPLGQLSSCFSIATSIDSEEMGCGCGEELEPAKQTEENEEGADVAEFDEEDEEDEEVRKEAEEAEQAKKKQAEAAEAERKQLADPKRWFGRREEFEEAMDRWRLPPELDEEVAILVAQHADLGLGDFADLSNGGGFKIQDTARRATSLRQLVTLAAHIIRRVEVNREEWSMKKYVDGVATDHCVTSAYEVCAAAKRGAG